MKKPLFTIPLIIVLIMSLFVTGMAFAQEGGPPGEGRNGILREYMRAALAEELGMSVDDLEARFAAGEKLMEIAQAQGYSEETLQSLMETVRQKALDAALADGAITQEQYDAFQERDFRGPGNWSPDRKGHAGNFLGLTREEIQSRLDAGQTIPEIAVELGVNFREGFNGQGRSNGNLAELLGLTQEELRARLDTGQTISEIAAELGVELPQHPDGQRPERPFGPGPRGNHFSEGSFGRGNPNGIRPERFQNMRDQ